MGHTDLTIIILNWNTCDLLRDCLDSVLRDPAAGSWQVVVVDNASTDGSAAMVRERFPEVELVTNSENVGFARANNRALGLARGRHMVLLNADTVVLDRALSRLLSYLERHPAVGAVGPALVQPDGSLPIVTAGHQPTIGRMLAQALALPRLLPARLAPPALHLASRGDSRPRSVEWLSGACLMVRRAVIEQVGPLSEAWFLYAEDLEWCDRIGRAGWGLVYLPACRVVHYERASVKQATPQTSTLWLRALYEHYARRCRASRPRRATFAATMALGWLLRAAPGLGRGRPARIALRYAATSLRLALLAPPPCGRGAWSVGRGASGRSRGR